jgi:hypothetical protein
LSDDSYSDFDWLHQQLVKAYPSYVVPPLPDKALTGNMDVDFINERMRGLESFLRRLAMHKELSKSKDLEAFLLETDEVCFFCFCSFPLTSESSFFRSFSFS